MAYDYVLVDISVSILSTSGAAGKVTFEVSDLIFDTTTGDLVVVPPIILAYEVGALTPIQQPFLATDSNSLSPGWSWIMTAELAGRITPIPRRSFSIKIANGPEQSLAVLAATSTILS